MPLWDALDIKVNPDLRVLYLPACINVKLVKNKQEVAKIGPYMISLRNFKQRSNVAASPAFEVIHHLQIYSKTYVAKLEEQARRFVPFTRIPSAKGVVFRCEREDWAAALHRQPSTPLQPTVETRSEAAASVGPLFDSGSCCRDFVQERGANGHAYPCRHALPPSPSSAPGALPHPAIGLLSQMPI